jgi:FMN phosphatase YigB (HAD superfamily)
VTERGIGAVTFDYWNTIMRPNPEVVDVRVAAWRAGFAEVGHTVSEDVLRDAFAAVWRLHHASWLRNEQYTGERAALAALAFVDRAVDQATRDTLIEAFTAQTAGIEPCEGIEELLAELHGRGLRLGIICDVGFTPSTDLRRVLDRFGLLGLFTGWSFSDEVGSYKPAPDIFRHALGYLDVPAARAAHIGDLRRTDVAGARAVGMLALRYCGAYDDTSDGPEGDHVIDHHAAVLALPDLSGVV